ncbi:unnamed protein product [Calicophoron daubneyi]|uniref:Prostamide/prostaglandin F synthase n=1 Tax=Calicophoron daubneyi TaxID=300641 RepID=A0AAV2T6Z2_CALDB
MNFTVHFNKLCLSKLDFCYVDPRGRAGGVHHIERRLRHPAIPSNYRPFLGRPRWTRADLHRGQSMTSAAGHWLIVSSVLPRPICRIGRSVEMSLANVVERLGSCMVQTALDGTPTALNTFWKDKTCVITFLRRFGCKFCRLEAKNLSKLKPALDSRQIRLIAISFDKDGLPQFIDGKFFDGELFVDPERTTYKALSYKRASCMSGLCSIFTKAGRELNAAANQANISGNYSGDGLQTGGLLVVEKGGNLLYEFRQEALVNHPDYYKIMQVLKIDPKEVVGLETEPMSCGDDVCTRP